MSVARDYAVEPSDDYIVAAVRAGRIGEYALLYQRYRDEALRIARRDAGPDDAGDLVQEAFARVLRAIRNGGGPTEDVAGYLFRTLRNLRIDRRGVKEMPADDVEALGPPGLWVVGDESDAALDRDIVSEAFKGLPPRWREVLWLTEVEGVRPGELSERMGVRPTVVTSLTSRARDGFRSAWLQAHVRARHARDECRPYVTRLGDYHTGKLSVRRRAQVDEHLEDCPDCTSAYLEMTAVAERLGGYLLPVVLLAPQSLWWVFGGGAGKAGLLFLGGAKAAALRLRDPKVGGSSAAAVALVAVAAVGAMFVSPLVGGASEELDPGQNAGASPSASAAPSTSGSDTAEPDEPAERADDQRPADSSTPEQSDDADVRPVPERDEPASTGPDAAEQSRPARTHPVRNSPAPQSAERQSPKPPRREPNKPVTQKPTAPTAPKPEPKPTAPTEPAEPEQLPPPGAPMMTAGDYQVYVSPTLHGEAVPGATVVLYGDGSELNSVTAQPDGTWSIVAQQAAQMYTVTQTVPAGISEQVEGTSPESDPVGPYEYTKPTWTNTSPVGVQDLRDVDGDSERDDIEVQYQAEPGSVEFFFDGSSVAIVDVPNRDVQIFNLTGVSPGEHEFGYRYINRNTGAVGTTASSTFTAA